MQPLEKYFEPGVLTMHYQPIFSMRECRVVGFEALCRISVPDKNFTLKELFKLAKVNDRVIELDRMCRQLAIEGFAPFLLEFPSAILFLNIESSIVDQGVVGSGQIKDVVQQAGIHPSQVCIEINESEVLNKDALIEFSRIYKRYGFLIAVDDLGAGHSNFERITQIQPDIVKLDMSLIQGMHLDHKKAQIVRLLCELSSNMGTLVVAEGVENYEEMIAFYKFGGDFVQGFYLAESFLNPTEFEKNWESTLKSAVQHAKDAEMVRLERGKSKQQKFRKEIELLAGQLSGISEENLEHELVRQLKINDDCECFYVIDENGIQVTETIIRELGMGNRNKNLYRVASKRANHGYKDYFYIPFMGQLDIYASEPYVSKATGNRCRTYSAWFNVLEFGRCLICMDIIEFD